MLEHEREKREEGRKIISIIITKSVNAKLQQTERQNVRHFGPVLKLTLRNFKCQMKSLAHDFNLHGS